MDPYLTPYLNALRDSLKARKAAQQKYSEYCQQHHTLQPNTQEHYLRMEVCSLECRVTQNAADLMEAVDMLNP
jgi:hypothetical protein